MPVKRADMIIDRRAQILEAAMICFAKRGFHQTSMHDVSAEAGISVFAVATFDTDYLLFKDQDLPNALAALRRAGHDVASGPPRVAT